jgi:hypothetical protein
METGQGMLLGGPVHRLECTTDCVQVQELKVIQAVVLSVVLMKVTADKVGDIDEARVNETPRGVTEDDRLEFHDRKEGGELDEVRDELESARRN